MLAPSPIPRLPPFFGWRVCACRACWRSAAPPRGVFSGPACPWPFLGRSVRAEPSGGARRFLGRGGSLSVSGGPVRAESSDGARRLWDGDCPARAPSPLAGLGAAASAAPGVRGFLGGRLSLCCEGERHCAAAGGRPLFGLRVSARRAFRRSAAPLRRVTAAPPGTPAVSRKVCACRAFWRSAALPRQGWVSASVWRACARRVFGQSAAPPRHSPPSLPFPSRAWRFGAAPPGVSAVGSPAAGGGAGDCGPGHYPPLPHAYPGGASCSFPLFKNPRPWVECATVVGVSFLRGPLESLLAGRPAWLPPRW